MSIIQYIILTIAHSELVDKFAVVKDIVIDADERMWIASNGLYCYNLKTGQLDDFRAKFSYSNVSPQTLINAIYIDDKERIWLGTNGAGVILFQPKNNVFKEFTRENSGLENNYISDISMTSSGLILAATSKGVSIVD